jgi:hypothetical protein
LKNTKIENTDYSFKLTYDSDIDLYRLYNYHSIVPKGCDINSFEELLFDDIISIGSDINSRLLVNSIHIKSNKISVFDTIE